MRILLLITLIGIIFSGCKKEPDTYHIDIDINSTKFSRGAIYSPTGEMLKVFVLETPYYHEDVMLKKCDYYWLKFSGVTQIHTMTVSDANIIRSLTFYPAFGSNEIKEKLTP